MFQWIKEAFTFEKSKAALSAAETCDKDLLQAIESIIILKDDTENDKQKADIFLKAKELVKQKPVPPDVTGRHILDTLIDICDEDFTQRIIDTRKSEGYYNYYSKTFNECHPDHIKPYMVQKAYHLFFPQYYDLLMDKSNFGEKQDVKSVTFQKLVQKCPEGVQSFMIDDFTNVYAQNKVQETSDYIHAIGYTLMTHRPDLITADHLSKVQKGKYNKGNFFLLNEIIKQRSDLITADNMVHYQIAAFALMNNSAYSANEIFKTYANNTLAYLAKNPVETIPAKIIPSLQLLKEPLSVSTDLYNDFKINLRLAGLYGAEEREKQIHRNHINSYNSKV